MSEPGTGPFDKNGIPIEVGDVVKVFHFIARQRRKRHYMYKQATKRRRIGANTYIEFSHLDMSDRYFLEVCDGRTLEEFEIIQSIDCKHEERPRAQPAAPATRTPESNAHDGREPR